MSEVRVDPWLVLRTRSRHESVVESFLQQKLITSYLPKCKLVRSWKGRSRVVEFPLFPGYVFVRPTPAQFESMRYIRGSCGLVLADNKPACLPEKDLASVKILVDSGISLMVDPELMAGKRVRIVAGPLAGMEGELVSVKSQDLLVVNIEMLNSSVRVDIDRDAIDVL
ncbi:hypothetical protein CR152_21445 [Massilia violaceinigra]|uniref:NusG-like N-terminal domain-containing protein n=1 Tax=Massilia violaceinigra TaxID=2045208 RepID=A0A2D2DP84_9BURK|nr:UpxY family transcription antiterminator [Massilia violaceinigra]ATQ76794.1 hypothetical protein CR152_21445 [Massilia violaceinigra]